MRSSRHWIFLSAAILLFCFAHDSHGLGLLNDTAGDELPEIGFEVIPSHKESKPGDEGVIAVVLDIPYNYHIQDDLDVEFEGAEGFETGEIIKPEGTFNEKVNAIFFYGRPHFAFPFKVSDDAEKRRA